MTKTDRERQRKAPILRFKGFTDDWEQRELREIAKKRTEKNRNLLTNNVLSNSAIYGIVKQTEYFDKSIANNIQNYHLVYENDFVYNPRISNNAPFGPISRNKLNELGIMSPLYLVFYFSTKSLSDYLEIYFKSSKWHKFMYMNGNSGARSDRFAIKDNDFFRMKIKMPHSKDEINKIYKFNILLYKLLTLYERKLKLLSQVKKYFLDNLFAEKEYPNLRFKGFTDAWEQRKLGEIGTTYSGLSGKNKSDFEKGNSNFITFLEVLNNPVLKNIDLTNKVEIKENEHQNKVKRNDLLFNTSSETPEEVATSTVVDVNQDNLYLNSFCFGFRPNVQFSNYYIGYYLRSNHFRSRVFCLAQGISRYNISKKSLIKLKLSLPKLKEQDKISRIFNQIELLLTLYENKQQHLTEIKKTLLNTMFI